MGRSLFLLCALAGGMLCVPSSAVAQATLVIRGSETYLTAKPAPDGTPARQWHIGIGTRERVVDVYVEPHPVAKDAAYQAVQEAVAAWNAVDGVPIRLRLRFLPVEAPVRIRWIDRFSGERAGVTRLRVDPAGRISGAVVTLAVRHGQGLPMSREFARMVALHELGHVLGLPHSENPRDVMHPGNRTLELSERDRAAARLLYGGGE